MEEAKGVAFDLDDALIGTESNLDWLFTEPLRKYLRNIELIVH